MIEFEFALQTWSGIAESLDAAGVDSWLPSHERPVDDGRGEGGEGGTA